MRTDLQSEASRVNGASSHGPVTVPGKLCSSQNAATTGVYSGKNLLRNTGDDIEQVANITVCYLDFIQPKNIVELQYTHRLINFHIRGERLARAEMGMFHIEALQIEMNQGSGCHPNPVYDFTGEDGLNRKFAHAIDAQIKDNDKFSKLLRAQRQINKGYDDALKAIQNMRNNPIVHNEPEPEPTEVESTTSKPTTKQTAELPPIPPAATVAPPAPVQAPERAPAGQGAPNMTIK